MDARQDLALENRDLDRVHRARPGSVLQAQGGTVASEPKWMTEWKSAPHPVDSPEETKRKLRSQAEDEPALRPLMERFPPLCLVRIKPGVRMFLLEPGEVGYAASYGDKFGNAGPGDHLLVRRRDPKFLPNGQQVDGAVCDADELEVIGYRGGLTPQFVRETFEPN